MYAHIDKHLIEVPGTLRATSINNSVIDSKSVTQEITKCLLHTYDIDQVDVPMCV